MGIRDGRLVPHRNVGSDGVGIRDLVVHQEGGVSVALSVYFHANAVGLAVLVFDPGAEVVRRGEAREAAMVGRAVGRQEDSGRHLLIAPNVAIGGPMRSELVFVRSPRGELSQWIDHVQVEVRRVHAQPQIQGAALIGGMPCIGRKKTALDVAQVTLKIGGIDPCGMAFEGPHVDADTDGLQTAAKSEFGLFTIPNAFVTQTGSVLVGTVAKLAVGFLTRIPHIFVRIVGDPVVADHEGLKAIGHKFSVPRTQYFSALLPLRDVAHIVQEGIAPASFRVDPVGIPSTDA